MPSGIHVGATKKIEVLLGAPKTLDQILGASTRMSAHFWKKENKLSVQLLEVRGKVRWMQGFQRQQSASTISVLQKLLSPNDVYITDSNLRRP